jgi:hypothetical protein
LQAGIGRNRETERERVEGRSGTFTVRDHYVARLVDLFDLLATAWRLARA